METTQFKISLRKDDVVQVISGRDKGKVGKILNVNAKDGTVFVEKLNVVKRHLKPTQKAPQGGIVEKELGLAYGKVLLFCNTCKRGVRHGKKLEKSAGAKKKGGEAKAARIRFCKRCKNGLGAA